MPNLFVFQESVLNFLLDLSKNMCFKFRRGKKLLFLKWKEKKTCLALRNTESISNITQAEHQTIWKQTLLPFSQNLYWRTFFIVSIQFRINYNSLDFSHSPLLDPFLLKNKSLAVWQRSLFSKSFWKSFLYNLFWR